MAGFWRISSVFLAIWIWSHAAPAWAAAKDDARRAAARSLGTEGVEAYQAGDFVGAADKLERAYQLVKAPTLGLWSARALEKLGKWIQAYERYLDVTRRSATGDAALQRQAQQEAEAAQRELEPRIPSLTVSVRGIDTENVVVTLDGATLPGALLGQRQPIDPGRHRVEGTSGDQRVVKDVDVVERGSAEVMLVFHEPTTTSNAGRTSAASRRERSAQAPRWQRTAGYLGIGVGGAALIFGGITAILAVDRRQDIEENPACHELACSRSEESLVDSYNSLRTLSSVGFVAGGVIAAAGITLFVTAPSASEPGLALTVAPGGLSLRGTY